jgi:tellurite resistance protein TerA
MPEAEESSPGGDGSGAILLSSGLEEVSLGEHHTLAGALRVSLRWDPGARAGGSGPLRRGVGLRRADSGVNLDLGCLYQFTDGQRGVIQAVGRRSGDYARVPFIRLDRDDRVGSSAGENIFINMDQSAHFQRILIFVMVAGGTDDLTRVGASVTIYPTTGPALEVRLEGSPTRARSCAVAQIRRRGPEMVVHRELRYFSGYQSEIDKYYNWGLHWGPGPGKSWVIGDRRARTGVLTKTEDIPVVIYVADEEVHESVEAAVEDLLAAAGLETAYRDVPVIGSWFRKSSAAVRDDVRPSMLRDAMRTAAHAADSRLVHAQDATVTATLMAGLGPLIAALQPTKDAAVRIGALLVVKVDWAVGVHQLTAAQQLKLDHNPQLVASPKDLIDILRLAPPSGAEGSAAERAG